MNDAKIPHQNQDIIYKYMAKFFRNETLEYYGLKLPKITNVKPTELPIIHLAERKMVIHQRKKENTYSSNIFRKHS